MDFEKEVADVVALIEPKVNLAEETAPIAQSSLVEIDRDYGLASAKPHFFHDAAHSIGGMRRGVELLNLLWDFIPPVHRQHAYDIVIIAMSIHDRYQDHGSANEVDSAEFGINKIEAADGALNTSFTKQRLRHSVGVTATALEAGRLVQPTMRLGARDPLKFSVGFADKNGIAMEGDKRMWSDAIRLYYETTPAAEQTTDGLIAFCGTRQRQFLRQGLNDIRIKGDVAYHFQDNPDMVYQALFSAFHQNIIEAHKQAGALSESSELHQALGYIARQVDRSPFGPLASELIRRLTGYESTDPDAS